MNEDIQIVKCPMCEGKGYIHDWGGIFDIPFHLFDRVIGLNDDTKKHCNRCDGEGYITLKVSELKGVKE